jgi:hypothetical protein
VTDRSYSSCLRVGSGVMKWPSWPLTTSSNARDIGRSLISAARGSRPDGVYRELCTWTEAAGIHNERVFRGVSSPGKPWGDGVTEKLAWHVVKEFATRTGLNLAPHDLRRCAACGIIGAPAHGFATLLATN